MCFPLQYYRLESQKYPNSYGRGHMKYYSYEINFMAVYKNSDPTLLKRQSISNAKTKYLMLFRDTIGIYFENQLEYTNTMRG